MTGSFVLQLYITGQNPRSEYAISNLRHICEQELSGQYDLVIIDIFQNPAQAEELKIMATPTLIRKSPLPVRRIIGDLSDTQKVLISLDLFQVTYREL